MVTNWLDQRILFVSVDETSHEICTERGQSPSNVSVAKKGVRSGLRI